MSDYEEEDSMAEGSSSEPQRVDEESKGLAREEEDNLKVPSCGEEESTSVDHESNTDNRDLGLKRPHSQSSDDDDDDDYEQLAKRQHLEDNEERQGEEGDDVSETRHQKEPSAAEEVEKIAGDEEEEVHEKEGTREEDKQLFQEGEEEEEEEEEHDLERFIQNELESDLQDLEQSEVHQSDQTPGSVLQQSSDSDVEDNKESTVSDFDLMMQRRKEAMTRARRKKKADSDSTAYDDQILIMIRQMKEAAEEDRRSNLQQKAATKKLQMLPTVVAHLKKADFMGALIECGICSALADWLKPLPDHSLPHQKIRENILDALKMFPLLDGHILKTSGLGKAVMLLYRHPKEIKKNRDKAGKLINKWARPVFGLTDDFKGLSRDEREERDWAHLSQAARRRLSSDSRDSDPARQDDFEPQKPGDKGWIGRARVPMPSNKDYVVRPKWNKQLEFQKGSSKKTLNRYEKQVQKKKEKITRGKNTHAVSISIEGRKMPL